MAPTADLNDPSSPNGKDVLTPLSRANRIEETILRLSSGQAFGST
jgi:hypothetical protein